MKLINETETKTYFNEIVYWKKGLLKVVTSVYHVNIEVQKETSDEEVQTSHYYFCNIFIYSTSELKCVCSLIQANTGSL